MKRILVIGSGGAGKSTFAVKIGKILDLPVIHIDKLHWQPGWRETPREDWIKIQRKVISRDKWIIDGNYLSELELRMSRADLLIFLDFSRYICIRRWIQRMIHYSGRVRPDMAPGCMEHFDTEMFKWLWKFPHTTRPKVYKLIEKYNQKMDIWIAKNPEELKIMEKRIISNFNTDVRVY